MWIDRKYCNEDWSPCIGGEFRIKGVTYELIAHGKKEGKPFWNIIDRMGAKEYDVFESDLFDKLQKNGIIK